MNKLAQDLTEEAQKAVVGKKIVAVRFNILLRDTKPGLYHAAFVLILDDGTVINSLAWPPTIELFESERRS